MKVILNKDLAPLGEEGDVRDVARGYARNYLLPRGIAVVYNDRTVQLFEARKGEIEARKEEKRKGALSLKERLEAVNLELVMPAGANGKLYGAVTSQTVMDELAKRGFEIERKRIELAGTNFKSVGKYKATIKLYESAAAEITITVKGQEIKTEPRTPANARAPRRRRDEAAAPAPGEEAAAAPAEAADGVPDAAPAPADDAAPAAAPAEAG